MTRWPTLVITIWIVRYSHGLGSADNLKLIGHDNGADLCQEEITVKKVNHLLACYTMAYQENQEGIPDASRFPNTRKHH